MPLKDPEKRREYRRRQQASPASKTGRKIYRENHKEEIRLNHHNRNQMFKKWAFDAYGGAVCVCCGETHMEFLSIDHSTGNGGNHRREIYGKNRGVGGTVFYRWLSNQGYPLGFRVLCLNCNFAIGAYGYCPHQNG